MNKKLSYIIKVTPSACWDSSECTIQISAFSNFQDLHKVIINAYGLKDNPNHVFCVFEDITNLCHNTIYYSPQHQSIGKENKVYTNKYELFDFGFRPSEMILKKFLYIYNTTDCDIKLDGENLSISWSTETQEPCRLDCIVKDLLWLETSKPIILNTKCNFEYHF